MVQWNAEKLNSLKARNFQGSNWIYSGLGFGSAWSQAPRLDLRSGENTLEYVLSSRPGEQRLILIPECFMV